jgi:hypothetical protein
MASTIHKKPVDCIRHAERIFEATGKETTVFYSVPSNLFACLPVELAMRMYDANPAAIELVAHATIHGLVVEDDWSHVWDIS